MAVPIAFQPLVKYVDFKGRARRQEYWLFWLVQVIFFSILNGVLITLMLQTFSTLGSASDPSAAFNPGLLILGQISNVISLGLLIPNLAVGVRRLHDTNRTGWWLILPGSVFIIGLILFLVVTGGQLGDLFAGRYENRPEALLPIIGNAFLMIWLPTMIASLVLFVFNLLDGTAGPNRFGPDPKGRGLMEKVEQTFT